MIKGSPATNNLVPTYSQAPFRMIKMHPQTISTQVTNMHKLGTVSLVAGSQLYCYHENGAGNDDYIVIIITQIDKVSNGNPMYYSETKYGPGTVAVHEWDQYFDYLVKITALDASLKPFANGLTIYDSSPADAKHGQKTLTDSVGVPDPFSIYMQVLNNGTWGVVNFPASYINIVDADTVKWFSITSLNNQSDAIAGLEFSTPDSERGKGDAEQVNFEMITIFKFDGSLVSNNTLPVDFKFTIDINVTQKYSVTVNDSNPVVKHEHHRFGEAIKTGFLDLVQITQDQSTGQ